MTQLDEQRRLCAAQPASHVRASIDAAMLHHRAGRLADAEKIYRQILADLPDQPDVLHLLGMLSGQTGKVDAGIELVSRAIRIKPNSAAYYDSLAKLLKSRGNIDEAIAAYREALKLNPDFAEAHNNLGVALRATGQLEAANAAFGEAIRIKPAFAEAYSNLGNGHVKARRFDEAIAACRQAIALKPAYADAFNNLGIALAGKGSIDEAIEAYRKALQINPNHVEALNNLGIVQREAGLLDESVAAHRRALELRPEYAEAHNNLGNTLRSLGQLTQSVAAYQRAVDIKPAYAAAHNNLGVALWETGRHAEAIAECLAAIELNPEFAEAHNSLANILRDRGDLDRAVEHYHRVLQLNPLYAEAHGNLAVALKDQGRLEEALGHCRRAIEIRPDHAAHSNLIYLLHFHPDVDPQAILREQTEWARRHAEPLRQEIRAHGNTPQCDRRLRIGYIAPYFRRHVVGLNVLPLLREHHHERFEIFCYSDVIQGDSLTEQCRGYADCWRDIVGMTDRRVAETIRADKIDILVDLSLHLACNRLLVLARKPAPVQATFAGYPAGTGLRTIDYRITDPYLDPPDADVEGSPSTVEGSPSSPSDYVEKSVRLSSSFWCYDEAAMTAGLDAIPQVNPLPARSAGYITFGCLNNFCKVNDGVLQLWARVLREVPKSRLLLLTPKGQARRRTTERLTQLGVSADRIEFAEHQRREQYLQVYHRIDVGLDTTPYNGHTTSLDSLWMGVPVVSLIGRTAVGRGGASILANAGVPELVAQTPEQYARLAAALAEDLPRLAELRRTLRARMRASPLMDTPRFARNVEAVYRQMWKDWCRRGGLALHQGPNSGLQCPAA
ncbi:MAG: tetratricopeptide repeat protein [Tepidisphaeraceae bacterium]|jgi:predicted O-linked N-acetylglucosamine transferase (SPINDLY family)